MAVERYLPLASQTSGVVRRAATLAAHVAKTPMAAISLIDADRMWFVGVHGFSSPRSVTHDDGLCAGVVAGRLPLRVSDALADSRLATNRFVRRHQVRFYACLPIADARGNVLGAVTVMDTAPRDVDQVDDVGLEHVAALVMEHFEAEAMAADLALEERRERDAVTNALEDARRDAEDARAARDDARRDRDDARSGRREAEENRYDARRDRDNAMRDRDIAERDRDVIEEFASVLQRTLLPPMLPEIPNLTVAAHYHPASSRQVGGDFYDVFALNETHWAFFIGDVEGHGAEAAVTTSLIRYTLRSAALHHRDLTAALTELNGVLLRELSTRRFCTVMLGAVRARDDEAGFDVSLATGGHPPALLVDSTIRTVLPVRPAGGMFVGAVPDARFRAVDFHLAPGQTLLLYTDGLIEARRGVRPFDEDALAAFVAERTSLDATGLVEDIATLVPKLEPDDDVAVLAITAR